MRSTSPLETVHCGPVPWMLLDVPNVFGEPLVNLSGGMHRLTVHHRILILEALDYFRFGWVVRSPEVVGVLSRWLGFEMPVLTVDAGDEVGLRERVDAFTGDVPVVWVGRGVKMWRPGVLCLEVSSGGLCQEHLDRAYMWAQGDV